MVSLNGDYAGSVTVSTNGGSFSAHGGTTATTKAIGYSPTGTAGVTLGTGTTLSTGAGNVALHGQGWSDSATFGSRVGVSITDSTITTEGGNVAIDGTGGNRSSGGGNAHGILLQDGRIDTTAGAGSVVLSGTGGSVSGGFGDAHGVAIMAGSGSGSTVAAGRGGITIGGTANSGQGANGVLITGRSAGAITSTVSAVDGGNISITGTGGSTSDANGDVRGVQIGGAGGRGAVVADTGTIVLQGTGGTSTSGSMLAEQRAAGVALVEWSSVTTTGAGRLVVAGTGGLEDGDRASGIRSHNMHGTNNSLGGANTASVLLQSLDGTGITLSSVDLQANAGTGTLTMVATGGGTIGTDGSSSMRANALRLIGDGPTDAAFGASDNTINILAADLASPFSLLAYSTDTGVEIGSVTSVATVSGARTTTNGATAGRLLLVDAGGALRTTQAITTTSGDIDLKGASVNVGAALTSAGSTDIEAMTGTLTQQAAGDITSAGAVTLSGAGGIRSAGDVSTTNAAITYASDLTLTGDVAISGGTGSKVLQNVVGDGHDLSFAGTGSTAGAWWQGVGKLTAPGGLTLSNAVVAASGSLGGTVSAAGLIKFTDDVTLTGATILSSTLGDVDIGGSVLGANQDLTVRSGLTTRLGHNRSDAVLNAGTLDVTAAGGIQVKGSVASTGTQRYRNAVTLLSDTTLRTTAASATGANITFDQGVTGAGFDLDVNAGTAGLTHFTGTASGIDRLTITGAATQAAAITASGLQLAGSGDVVLANADNGFSTIAASKTAGDIDVRSSVDLAVGTLASTGVVTVGDISLRTSNSKNIALGASVTAGTGDVDLDAAASITRSAGTVSGAAVTLTASGGSVTAAVAATSLTGSAGTSATLTGNAGTLDGFSTGTGFQMTDSGGLTVAAAVTGGSGMTSIGSSGGNLVVNAGISGTGVSLSVTGGGALALNAGVNAGTGTATLGGQTGITRTAGTVSGAEARLASTNGDITDVVVDVSGAASVRARDGSIVDLDLTSGSAEIMAGTSITGSVEADSLTGRAATSATLTTTVGTLDGFGVGTSFSLTNTGALEVTGALGGGTGQTTIDSTGLLTVSADVSGAGVRLDGLGVTQAAGTTINGGAGLVVVDGNGSAIDLAGAVTTTNATASAVRILDASTAMLGDITTGADGTVVIGGTGTDNIAAVVGQHVGSAITAGTVTVNSGGAVSLAGANQVTNLGAVTSAGGFTFNDSTGGLSLTGDVADGTGPVRISTAGGALALGGHDVSGSGVSLTGTGVTQAAASTVDAGSGGVTVDGNDGALALAGTITTTSNSATAVQFVDAASAVIGSVNAADGTVVIGGAGGDAIGGAVSQSGSSVVTAATLKVNAGGAVSLANANSVATLAGATSNGNFAFTNAGALNVGGAIAAGSGGVALQTSAGQLSLAAAGDITAGGAVTLTGAGGIRIASDITADDADVTFNNATTLTGPVSVSAGSGAVSFANTVGNDGTARNLALDATGGVTAGGAITGIDVLTTTAGTDLSAPSLSVNSASLGGDVTTTASSGLVFGSLTLTGDVALDAGAANTITLGTVAGGGHDLTLTGLASTTGAGNLGALVANQTLTTTGAVGATSVAVAGAATLGGDVTTTGGAGQSYGSTTLTSDAALDAGAANAISLGAVTGDGNDLGLTGLATTTGVTGVGALAANQTLTTTGAVGATSVVVAGAATLGGDVTTTGGAGQSYGSTTLTTGVALDAGAANAIALGAVTGNGHDLVLTGQATTAAANNLGALVANQALTATGAVGATSVAVAGAATLGGDVTTTGAAGQSYGSTTLTNDLVLDAGAANAIRLGGVTGNGNDLALTGQATTTGARGVGAFLANQSLATTGDVQAASVTVRGTASLGGDVTTTAIAGQSYGGTTLDTDVELDAGATNAIHLGAVSGNGNDLALTGRATTSGVRGVGALRANQSLATTGDVQAASVAVAGTASLGGDVTTAGAQSYGAIGLAGDVALQGRTLDLGTVAGHGNDLALAGRTTAGSLTGVAALTTAVGSDLAATRVAAASATLGGDVATTGTQAYGATRLGADVVLTGSRLSLGSVTGDGNDLALVGRATLAGTAGVGALVARQDLATTGAVRADSVTVGGAASLGGDVHTTGTQSYGSTRLQGDVALEGSTLVLNDVAGNGNDLLLAGATTADRIAGVDHLRTTAGSTLAADSVTARSGDFGGDVRTTGTQRYDQLATSRGVQLAAASLSAGRASLAGGVTTSGGQGYGALEVTGDVTLRSTASGAIAMEDVTGSGDLAVQTGGRADFGGTVAVGSLDVDALGGSTLSGDVATRGDQRWRNDLHVAGLRALTLHAGGTLVTEGAIDTNPAMNLRLSGDGGVTVNARALGEVDELSLASATSYVHLTNGREAHGGQGVLARGGLVIDAPRGQLNFPHDLLRLHPLTPAVTTIAAPLGVWIETAQSSSVRQVVGALSFETDRYLRRMLRRDAGLLPVEDLALRTSTPPDALVAPALSGAPQVRQPDCLPEQGRGQPCTPAAD